jgi:hypothetical protein
MAGALVACLAMGGAGSAAAATLSYAGTLSFTIWTLPSGTAGGGGVYVGPLHISTIGFNAGQFGPLTTSVPATSSQTVNSVVFTGMANMTGILTALSGGPPGGGSMGLSGVAKVCLVFAPCPSANVTVPLTPSGTPAAGFGVGNTQTVPGGMVPLTMQHAPWTIGQPVMTIHTPGTSVTTPPLPGGYASPPSATAANSGVLQLVTATKAFTSLTGAFPEVQLFSILKLHFLGAPTPTPTPTPTSTPTPVGKVTLCHKGKKTISVGAPAVPAHLSHGDIIGPCS